MPIHAENHQQWQGTTPAPFFPCTVVDADNCEVRHCVYVDTETGIVISHVYKDGFPVLTKDGGSILRVIEKRPLPLKLVNR